jgi:hypothetical protein
MTDYNLSARMGISDQELVEMYDMPQSIANTPDIHLWMTYYIYLGNLEHEKPEEVPRLLSEHFMNMRLLVSPRHWAEMDIAYVPENNGASPRWDPEWYFDDDYLLNCCKSCYELNPPTKEK